MSFLDGLGATLRQQLAYIAQTDAQNKANALSMAQQGFVPRPQEGGTAQRLLSAFTPGVQGIEAFTMAPWHPAALAQQQMQAANERELRNQMFQAAQQQSAQQFSAKQSEKEAGQRLDEMNARLAAEGGMRAEDRKWDVKRDEVAAQRAIDLAAMNNANDLQVAALTQMLAGVREAQEDERAVRMAEYAKENGLALKGATKAAGAAAQALTDARQLQMTGTGLVKILAEARRADAQLDSLKGVGKISLWFDRALTPEEQQAVAEAEATSKALKGIIKSVSGAVTEAAGGDAAAAADAALGGPAAQPDNLSQQAAGAAASRATPDFTQQWLKAFQSTVPGIDSLMAPRR